MSSNQFPLSGIVVLDLTQIMAGPVCTMLLADMGADVVKIEKPNGGDDTRRLGPPFVNGWGAGFLALNRHQRSLGVNPQKPPGRGVVQRVLHACGGGGAHLRPD